MVICPGPRRESCWPFGRVGSTRHRLRPHNGGSSSESTLAQARAPATGTCTQGGPCRKSLFPATAVPLPALRERLADGLNDQLGMLSLQFLELAFQLVLQILCLTGTNGRKRIQARELSAKKEASERALWAYQEQLADLYRQLEAQDATAPMQDETRTTGVSPTSGIVVTPTSTTAMENGRLCPRTSSNRTLLSYPSSPRSKTLWLPYMGWGSNSLLALEVRFWRLWHRLPQNRIPPGSPVPATLVIPEQKDGVATITRKQSTAPRTIRTQN